MSECLDAGSVGTKQ